MKGCGWLVKNIALINFIALIIVSYFAEYQLSQLGILITMLVATIISIAFHFYGQYAKGDKEGGK